MTVTTKVIRLNANGPDGAGLEKMELDPADFQTEIPDQFVHVFFEDQKIGLSVGTWTTTTMQEAFGPYPGDEFMCILKGQVAMVDGDGDVTRITTGQTFCTRNGIPISWKQDGFLQKFYMTYVNPNAETPKISSADGGVRLLNETELQSKMQRLDSPAPFEFSKTNPVQHLAEVFENDTGNFFVGMWDSAPFISDMKPFPTHEFVQLLEGAVTIIHEDGSNEKFSAGDVFFIPCGTVCSWKCDGYIKKFYATLDPNA